MMAVPTPIRSVRAATHATVVTASDPYASALHTESNPRRSASCTSGITSTGAPVQYPMCKASFIESEVYVTSPEGPWWHHPHGPSTRGMHPSEGLRYASAVARDVPSGGDDANARHGKDGGRGRQEVRRRLRRRPARHRGVRVPHRQEPGDGGD